MDCSPTETYFKKTVERHEASKVIVFFSLEGSMPMKTGEVLRFQPAAAAAK